MSTSQERGERTLGQLVADATNDFSAIVRNEIALAKAEITEQAKTAGAGAGMFAAAAFVALLGVIFLFHSLAYILDIWLPLWVSYLITTALLFSVAAGLAAVGRKTMNRVNPRPERTIRQAEETIDVLKSTS